MCDDCGSVAVVEVTEFGVGNHRVRLDPPMQLCQECAVRDGWLDVLPETVEELEAAAA